MENLQFCKCIEIEKKFTPLKHVIGDELAKKIFIETIGKGKTVELTLVIKSENDEWSFEKM